MDFNITKSYINSERSLMKNGIHQFLIKDYNRYAYPLAISLSFAVVYYIINKIVYRITDNEHVHNICIQKYKLKLSKSQKITTDSNERLVLIDDEKKEKSNEKNEDKEELELDLLNLPQVQYHLWFFRFSLMECISCLLIWPLLIHSMTIFSTTHNDYFTFVAWDTYIIMCMMIGHYLVDFDQVFSHGYASRSRDLLLHHLIALVVFYYHLFDLMNFEWISLILFFEFNSFFNRSNLILKYYDPEQTGFLWNFNSSLNFATMFGVRFVILIRIYFYIPVNFLIFNHHSFLNYLIMFIIIY